MNTERTSARRSTFLPALALSLLLGLGLGLAGFGLNGCNGSGDGMKAHAGDEHDHDDHARADHTGHNHGNNAVVVVDDETIERAGIVTQPLSDTPITEGFALPGVVRPEGDRLAKVGTLLPGRVAALYVEEGRFVTKGTRLADIESVQVGEARAEYLEAVAAETRAAQALERETRLAGERIGAQKSLEEATAEFQRAKALRNEATAHLRSLGIAPEEAGSSFANRLTVRAPISGVVAERPVTIGEYVGPDADLFTLVNTSVVWIDAEATPAQAARLETDARALVRTPTGETIGGRLTFISPVVTPDSKTVRIRVEARNPEGTLRPGGFVTAEFRSERTERGLVIPERGIERDENRYYVYRRYSPNEFERVMVDARRGPEGSMILTEGVEPGDEIAVSGIFYIRSIMAGDELSEHHH